MSKSLNELSMPLGQRRKDSLYVAPNEKPLIVPVIHTQW